jgi:hypothetical protein
MLEPDSLGEIARRMDDIGGRLDRGRAGPKVKMIEGDVIASLDKLIKKLEDEEKKKSSSSSSGSGNLKSQKPAQKSGQLGGKGPGRVDKKKLREGGNWGDLPQKDRDEVIQRAARDYPVHCRDIVEQYFRKLATEDTEHK